MTELPTTLDVWAPGRVNLIGDHTDYNDGWVLPLAIELGTSVRASRRQDQTLVSTAQKVPGRAGAETDRVALAEIAAQPFEGWRAYVRGTAQALIDADLAPPGAELAIDGTIPLGGGLSSSASLEIGVAMALLALNGRSLPPDQLALLAQSAERRYAGVNCGIMDQLAVAAGVADHALLIDCRSLAVEPVPLPPGAAVLIVESGAPRSLAGSAYNERRAQCEAAVAALRQLDPAIRALRDVSSAMLADAHARGLIEGLIHQRARHVVSENERTVAAAAALRQGDTARVGQLMNESHQSLRDDYAVSSPELDTLTGLLREQAGVFGARLTGAGFGGCCVALVASEHAAAVAAAIPAAYQAAAGRAAQVWITKAAGGARVVGA